MDDTQKASQIEQLIKLNEELRQQNIELQKAVKKQNHDHEALLISTQTLIDDREKLQYRVEELEAVNRRLVDMLWGRLAERRIDDPNQQELDFGDVPGSSCCPANRGTAQGQRHGLMGATSPPGSVPLFGKMPKTRYRP